MLFGYVVVSQNRGPQYRLQNILILILGTPKEVRTPNLTVTPRESSRQACSIDRVTGDEGQEILSTLGT